MAGTFYEVDWSTLPAPGRPTARSQHLTGLALPRSLASTAGNRRLAALRPDHRYIYPKTAARHRDARRAGHDPRVRAGCTPQSCASAIHFAELKALGVTALFGPSTQDTAYRPEGEGSAWKLP